MIYDKDIQTVEELDLEPGDIGACQGSFLLRRLQQYFFEPSTDRIHYFILFRQIRDGDWVILESINKGVAVGLLSFYNTTHVEFYRVNCPQYLRYQAPEELVRHGRSKYDFLLAGNIVLDVFIILINRLLATAHMLTCEMWTGNKFKLRKIRAEDFKYSRNSALICTEAVDVAYLGVGVSIVGDVIPIPPAFKQAELDGTLTYLGDNGVKPAKISRNIKERRTLCYTPGKTITEGCRIQKT